VGTLHFHAAVNHLPLGAIFFGLAIISAGVVLGKKEYVTIAFALFAAGALLAIATVVSGNFSHETVEKLTWIEHKYVEAHEEGAELALYLTIALGALMVFGHFKFKSADNTPKWFFNLSVALAVGSLVTLLNAGRLGGEISHKEFRPDFKIQAPEYPTGIELTPVTPELLEKVKSGEIKMMDGSMPMDMEGSGTHKMPDGTTMSNEEMDHSQHNH